MGNCLGRFFSFNKTRRHIVLILIGLDNAGKTRTVNNLVGDADTVMPTVGFKGVNLIHRDTPVTIYDLGGGPQFRQIWSQYYSEVHGVIFVIDSSDYNRLDECKEVLDDVISHDKISGKPILILANKQDKQGALDDIDVVEKLNIEPLVNRYRCPTLVESYTASLKAKTKPKIDPGLKKGYTWLLNYILHRYGDINLRVQTDIHSELERRKRLSEKPVLSDFISQTGFENPNFNKSSSVILVREKVETIIVESDSNKSGNSDKSTGLLEKSGLSVVPDLSDRSEKRSPILNSGTFSVASTLINKNLTAPVSVETSPEKTSNSSYDTGTRESFSQTYTMPGKMAKDIEINRETSSEMGATVSRTLPARPASASQIVRKQLELLQPQKRRLSLRHIQRNKTSPENHTLYHFEPLKGLNKGDFTTYIGNGGDVTL